MSEPGCIPSLSVNTLHVHGKTTHVGGVINNHLTESDATSTAIDLTHITADHTLHTTGALSHDVKLPQATVSNKGMKIEVYIGATTESGDGSCTLSVKGTGSTVFFGAYTTCIVGGGASAKESTSIGITNNAKSLILDSNNVATAGGDKGSHYTFKYLGTNKIYVTGIGLVSGTTATAPTADGSTTAGFS